MASLITNIHIIVSILLIALILIQQSEAGIGAVFGGGDSDVFHHTRRGFEKILFNATIVLSILFVVLAVLPLAY